MRKDATAHCQRRTVVWQILGFRDAQLDAGDQRARERSRKIGTTGAFLSREFFCGRRQLSFDENEDEDNKAVAKRRGN